MKGKKRTDITKRLLERLYIKEKLSMYKVAKELNTTYITVWKKIKKYDIKVRTISEANTKYPKPLFSGNLKEKAYMLGLRYGDISAKRNGRQVMVYTSTTHLAQVKMFQSVFEKYTHRIYCYIGSTPKNMAAWKISCKLHESFDYMLVKSNKIPKWIIENNKFFYAFLASYADCEGNWDIGKQSESKNNRVRFRIKSGDKDILEQIKNRLEKLKFRVTFRLERLAVKYGYNKDIYCLQINYKNDVIRLAKILLNLSCHMEKICKMKLILENSGKSWEETEDKIENFRNWMKKSRLDNNIFISPLHSTLRAMRVEDECSQ